ncbi:hypothetical protein YC2023_089244 [Brassica napus]
MGDFPNSFINIKSEASGHEGFSNMVVTHEEEAAKTQLVSIKEDQPVRALDHNKKSTRSVDDEQEEWVLSCIPPGPRLLILDHIQRDPEIKGKRGK